MHEKFYVGVILPISVPIYNFKLHETAALASVSKSLKLTLHFDEEQKTPLELNQLLASYPSDAYMHCCGPTPMLDAYEKTSESSGYRNVHIALQLFMPRHQQVGSNYCSRLSAFRF